MGQIVDRRLAAEYPHPRSGQCVSRSDGEDVARPVRHRRADVTRTGTIGDPGLLETDPLHGRKTPPEVHGMT